MDIRAFWASVVLPAGFTAVALLACPTVPWMLAALAADFAWAALGCLLYRRRWAACIFTALCVLSLAAIGYLFAMPEQAASAQALPKVRLTPVDYIGAADPNTGMSPNSLLLPGAEGEYLVRLSDVGGEDLMPRIVKQEACRVKAPDPAAQGPTSSPYDPRGTRLVLIGKAEDDARNVLKLIRFGEDPVSDGQSANRWAFAISPGQQADFALPSRMAGQSDLWARIAPLRRDAAGVILDPPPDAWAKVLVEQHQSRR